MKNKLKFILLLSIISFSLFTSSVFGQPEFIEGRIVRIRIEPLYYDTGPTCFSYKLQETRYLCLPGVDPTSPTFEGLGCVVTSDQTLSEWEFCW